MNQVIIVGRLTKDPEIYKEDGNKKRAMITVAVNRQYKNPDGIYETDFINCILWNVIAENTCEYCKKGDVVGVKGRIQSDIINQEDGNTKYYLNIIAEKVTFLSSKKADE